MTKIDFDRLDLRWFKSECFCDSGDEAWEVVDSRGIYLTSGCPACLPEKLKGYRADVLYGPTYETEERIEPEEDDHYVNSENIYGVASIRQSIEEDRR